MNDATQSPAHAPLFEAPDVAIEFRAVAWLVEAPGQRTWVEADDPERYRMFGYDIQPLVRESDARRMMGEAVHREHKLCVDKHATDLLMLAKIVQRLRNVMDEGYIYDTRKIRDDLAKWGFIESGEAEPAVETPAGRRLALVIELDWIRTKTNWGLLRSSSE